MTAEIVVNIETAEKMLDELTTKEMAMLFNDEKFLEDTKMCEMFIYSNKALIECLDKNGRKHIKELYNLVCDWYKKNPEEAELEGYTEW